MQAKTFFNSMFREPLLHFSLIGAAVFMLYPADSGTLAAPAVPTHIIEITPQVRDGLAAQFAATWNRQPTAAELDGLLAEHIKEEVLYREALALGLDQDDSVVRQRMRLKMEFIGEGAAAALVPTDAELAAWFAAQADAYAAPATVTFEQIMLADPAEATATLAALSEGADPATLGRGTLLPGEVEQAAALSVDGTFGTGFFDSVAGLATGTWSGPLESAYGTHLVRLQDVALSAAPPLDTVRDVVIEDWRREQAALQRETQYQALLSRYEIRLPEQSAE